MIATEFPFPPQAEEAIVAYAEYLVMRLPGKGKDLVQSERALNRYRGTLAELQSAADTGESGSRAIFDFLPAE